MERVKKDFKSIKKRQKQPPKVFYKALLKFRNIQRKAPVLESLFHKVAGLHVKKIFKRMLLKKVNCASCGSKLDIYFPNKWKSQPYSKASKQQIFRKNEKTCYIKLNNYMKDVQDPSEILADQHFQKGD